jgi:hypothetical protein
MAEKVTIEGKIDDKPMPQALKTKVQDALKTALQAELTVKGPNTPTHHYSITHYSVVFDQT